MTDDDSLQKILSENGNDFGGLISTLEKATEAMIEMRKKEGLEIATDFQVRIEKLDSMVDQMEEESKDLPEIIRKKLFERLQKADLEICSSDDRVLKELALYSEKFDVSEEITRLRSHLKQFSETCSTDGFIGRKLEFILQEINSGKVQPQFCTAP